MSSESTAPSCHQVLVVDDNEDVREALSTVLQVEGFDVAPAWDVEDALRHLHQGLRPCVVLLDLHMPGMDGWAFLDRIRIEPHLHDTPVIIISGDENERAEAQRRRCGFFLKAGPFNSLIAAVNQVCQRH
jgi:CheY-like chemotaxis protein